MKGRAGGGARGREREEKKRVTRRDLTICKERSEG